jgi:hypothetical protein
MCTGSLLNYGNIFLEFTWRCFICMGYIEWEGNMDVHVEEINIQNEAAVEYPKHSLGGA